VTLARALFLGGLAVVLVGTVASAVAVYATTARATSHRAPGEELWDRLRRLPSDRAEQATWAFLAHRVSGIGIFLFLALHIVDVGLFSISADLYDDVHELFASTPMRVLECGLLVALLFHTFNGIRLLVVDLADLGPTATARALTLVVAATFVLGVAGSVVILAPVF
jgi:succinate dehydrogenase / fumarate reductase cytochrome b subunit